MNCVKIGNTILGEGRPKICVPIVGRTAEKIAAQAQHAAETAADLAEWRVDFYENWQDTGAVAAQLAVVAEAMAPRPVLVTFRTAGEGGEAAISPEAYRALNLAVAESRLAAMVDVELFFGEEVYTRELIAALQEKGCKVIASNHDFHATPAEEEIIRRLCLMQEYGADVLKIAVMPTCTEDVLTLLSATNRMRKQYAEQPIVTMSMSGLGAVSRLCGEAFGSAMTFGSAGKASAPGQVEIEVLKEALEALSL